MEDNKPCHDCAAPVGTPHDEHCDVARCKETGHQRLTCDDAWIEVRNPDHNCGQDVWTGLSREIKDCRRLNFWCYWGPPWIPCEKDHPEATEDLNTLYSKCCWDKETQRFELRS